MYSIDVRKIACRLYTKYNSLRKVSLILEISHSTISRWLKNIERKQYFRKPKLCTDFLVDLLKTTIIINPFISIRQLLDKVKTTCNINVSRELIRTAIAKLGFTKKNARFFSHPKNLHEKTSIFLQLRKQFCDENRPFYSIDETSFGRNTKTVRGYSLKGKLLRIQKSQPRMTTVSSLVIMSQHEIIKHKEIQGSYNKLLFIDFLKDLDLPSNSVILLDNVKFHHSLDVKELAKSKHWTLLYTPPYSPWFNPIEGIFSIVKRAFYSSYDIQKSFETVTQKHCNSFFNYSFHV